MANPATLTVNTCVANGSINQPAVQTIDTNATINVPGGHPTDRMIFEVVNLAVNAIDVILKGGVTPPSLLAGDMKFTLSATGGGTDKRILGPFESGRFIKADGTIDVNFQASTGAPNLTLRIYKLPKQI